MNPDPRAAEQPWVHPTAIVEDSVVIGSGTKIWDHAHVRARARIGTHCIVGEKTYIAYDVVIGNLCKLNANVYVCTGVTLEDGCLIAAHVVFANEIAPRATDRELRRAWDSGPTERTLQTVVRRGATVGTNATIGPGLELGAHCMVGMGAVVTHDVPAHGLVTGNPARLVGLVARDGTRVWRCEDGQLPPIGTAVPCPDDGTLFVVERDRVEHRP